MSSSTPKARRSAAVKIADGIAWLFLVLLGLVVFTMAMPIPSCFPIGNTKELQVRSMMKSLEIAFKGHSTEYGSEVSLAEFWRDEGTPILAEGEILKVLTGENERFNPRKIAFLEPPPVRAESSRRPGMIRLENGNFRLVDHNGNPIWMLIDVDGDKSIPNPDQDGEASEDERFSASILLYTAGEDGNPTTWRDNLKSWE